MTIFRDSLPVKGRVDPSPNLRALREVLQDGHSRLSMGRLDPIASAIAPRLGAIAPPQIGQQGIVMVAAAVLAGITITLSGAMAIADVTILVLAIVLLLALVRSGQEVTVHSRLVK